MSYNGWSNRETWLVNLWYGDSFGPMIENEIEEGEYSEEVTAIAEGFPDKHNERAYLADLAYEIGQRYESWVYETIQEELDKISGFLSDFISLDEIDWTELGFEIVNEYFKN